MTTYYLIRHPETLWNAQARLQGHGDAPLSDLGKQQAAGLLHYLERLPLRHVCSSDLPRAKATAEAIARRLDLTHTVDPALREIHLGAWEGLTAEEVNARFDNGYRRWLEQPTATAIEGAEGVPAFRRRIRQAWHRLTCATTRQEHVAVVTHGGVITALLADYLGASFDRLITQLHLANCGITTVQCNGQGHAVSSINQPIPQA